MAKQQRMVEAGRIKRVKVKDLLPDPKNREIKWWWINERERSFDFGKWTPPVARENADGTFTLIEGHHRVLLANKVGLAEAEVCVYVYPPIDADSRVGEMYNGINDKISHTAAEKFLGRLRAEDKLACQTDEMIRAAGWKGIQAKPEDGWVHTPSHFERALKSLGTKPVGATLKAISTAYGRTRDSVRPEIVRGFALFFKVFPDVSPLAIARNVGLDHDKPKSLVKKGADLSEAFDCQRDRGVAIAIWQAWNNHHSESNQLPPVLMGRRITTATTDKAAA